jgi:hypothetical protein
MIVDMQVLSTIDLLSMNTIGWARPAFSVKKTESNFSTAI